ncbi:sigma-70 family RNA polymerase sigma factor [Jiangella asiatica]|uniref:Sigma-70 family RNA polymerase sigma factor n=1 Tax=Jiangella asiatica TaxID=2530372 RepID=A0A4R5DKZ7_9ACTN|nr:sigma-70 family RNA polymerase sigma factor [Jiangella asiatica]
MTDQVERIAAIDDRFELLREASERINVAQREVTELARLRRRVIQELRDQGLSYADIAAAAGVTRGRIFQLRQVGPAPEAALLGSGQVEVLTPLKREAGNARPVVAAEDFTAAQRLGELARSLRLDVEYEQIPTTGKVNLNRDNLIVICGPRLSEPVANVLSRDPVIQFERAPDGPWTLHDTRTSATYRSGPDSTPEVAFDVAYLGRLPRPDREGTILVLTGIHPPGSLGVVHLLTSDLAALYEQAGTEPFSTVVGVDYDSDTHEPVAVRLLTPIYRHEDH